MIIHRSITSTLLEDLTFFPVVGIIGSRQVGKTTLAKSLTSKLAKPSLYLDLELSSDRERLRDPEVFLSQFKDKCVILDEIQQKPELFPLLRAMTDQQRVAARFIILGSASPDLLRKVQKALLAG